MVHDRKIGSIIYIENLQLEKEDELQRKSTVDWADKYICGNKGSHYPTMTLKIGYITRKFTVKGMSCK